MIERDIAATDRSSFFAGFSKLHSGALVTLCVDSRDEVLDQPFRGLSVDGADVIVNTGDGADRPHLGHRVPNVKSVRLEQTGEGADAAVAMTSDDGTRTDVRFRSPMRADLLDPLVE
jgi:hypothetical protein